MTRRGIGGERGTTRGEYRVEQLGKYGGCGALIGGVLQWAWLGCNGALANYAGIDLSIRM